MAKKIWQYVPGVALSLGIAVVARWLEGLLPIHVIGASVIAMFIGIAIHEVFKTSAEFAVGAKFMSKRVLKFAIVLLGASLSVGTILTVGGLSLNVMLFTLLTCFGGGYFVGKWLGLDWKLSSMISAGTGICGGSAIAALSPVIEAEDSDVAYAISATFLFDMVMIVVFPMLGHWLNLSDMAYGLWAGTAVNDTSSVVAAGYAFSEAAGDFATMVKLTRTLSIIPTVLVFSVINLRKKRAANLASGTEMVKVNWLKLFPWFIACFVLMAVLNSAGIIPQNVSSVMKDVSKFLMVAALAAIGLNTDLSKMRRSGVNPMIHGFIISLLVVLVAIAVEACMGLV